MRYRMQTNTALALIFVAMLGGTAEYATKLGAAPIAAMPPELTPAQAIAARFVQNEAPATTENAATPAPAIAAATTPAPATEAAPAAEPVTTPDPLASLDPADRPIAEKIGELLNTKADKLFANKNERAAVTAFYQERHNAPVWFEKGVETTRATAAVARIKNADADGLDAGDYKLPNLAASGADAQAEAELKLTLAVLTFARHLQAGRFHYTRVSKNIELPQALPEPADILKNVADAADAGKALDAYSPPQDAYRKLKATLADLRSKTGANKGQVDLIVANMERWRWYARDLGKAHVIVNHPDFTLRVMNNGREVWTTRVVIGKPSMATPLLSETMKSITVNPTWTVPQSIVRNEYMPALAQDPTVLERMGLRVSYNGGGVTITQPPGEGNALGRLRFNINNRFSVFQHDTQDKHMFGHDVRAYSHGCMRVQDPAKYAEVLLNIVRPNEHWTAERIKRMYGTSEQNLQILPTALWVHLTYQTAFVDGSGKLQTRRDVYGLDSRVIAAIKNDRGTVEPSVERKRTPEMSAGTSPQRAAPPARVSTNARSIYGERATQPAAPRSIFYR
jgi:L,D-transpeptidase YcbB